MGQENEGGWKQSPGPSCPRTQTLVLGLSLSFVLEVASGGDKVRVTRSTLCATGNGS